MKIGLIGGDIRYKYLVEYLKCEVEVYGNKFIYEVNHDLCQNNITKLLSNNKIIIVPIPFTKDDKTVYMKENKRSLFIDDFINELKSEHILIGGPFNSEFVNKVKTIGTKLIDITSIDSFKRDNAIPTAEGVIAKLVERTNYTIFNSKALVLGYGYCGKRIAYLIKLLGGEVSIYTENKSEVYEALKMGFNIYNEVVKPVDYIINTIPIKTLSIEDISKKIFIDITNAYEVVNNNSIKMRGIPGRVSPVYAGKIIAATVNEILKNINLED